MGKNIKKIKMIILLSTMTATVLGIYAQDISHFINGTITDVSLIYTLTIITIISMLLYVATPILVYWHTKEEKSKKKSMSFYLWMNSIIGVPISAWSFFVMIM